MLSLIGSAALALTALLTARSGNPALFPGQDGDAVRVYLVSNSYHSGLVMQRQIVAALAERDGKHALLEVARRFAAYETVGIGWGDEQFYRHVRRVASLTWKLALQALF
jgi:hypothetical protein